MTQPTNLSPIERVVRRLAAEGASPAEIGRRIGKKPGTVTRIAAMSSMRTATSEAVKAPALRPIEAVVLRLRSEGEGYSEIGNRLGRSGRHVQSIERYARLKLAD